MGNQIWLNSQNILTQRPFKKLDNKWIGPFKVLELIGKRACWLELPETLWIHPVFHVSLLRLAAQDSILGQSNQRPGLVIGTNMDNPNVYKVESIIDSQAPCGQQKFKYLVKWKGWSYEYNTKEPVELLEGSKEAIWTFHEQYSGNHV